MSDILKMLDILMDDDQIKGDTYYRLRELKQEIETREIKQQEANNVHRRTDSSEVSGDTGS